MRQEGLQLSQDQEQEVLEARARVMLWLEKADVLRAEAYVAIGEDLVWQAQVGCDNDSVWLSEWLRVVECDCI